MCRIAAQPPAIVDRPSKGYETTKDADACDTAPVPYRFVAAAVQAYVFVADAPDDALDIELPTDVPDIVSYIDRAGETPASKVIRAFRDAPQRSCFGSWRTSPRPSFTADRGVLAVTGHHILAIKGRYSC